MKMEDRALSGKVAVITGAGTVGAGPVEPGVSVLQAKIIRDKSSPSQSIRRDLFGLI